MEIYSLFAHTLNLIVQEATENNEELPDLRRKCRNIVTHFKQSIKARDQLSEVQKQMGGEEKKSIRDRCDNQMELIVLHV